MIKFANAKINLGLNILRKRTDGYHDLDTIFYPIPLYDIVEIIPSTNNISTLTISGRTVDCPTEKNLVMKAYRILESKYNLPAVNIYLHKVIPDGAGLGGGSSDATHTALALNEIFELNIPETQLATMLATVGADCPFFIYNKPLLAGGIGNIFQQIDITLKGKTILLIKPEISVPTKVAFSKVTPNESRTELKELITLPIEQWRGVIGNDFETSVFSEFPELESIKWELYSTGAIYASMSGSGSSIFGIYENDILAEQAKEKLANMNCYILNL